MPFGTFQISPQEAFAHTAQLMAAGAQMVKLEGGAAMVETVRFLTERGIPVCGHIGLTPQSVHQLGGYRVQGKESAAAEKLLEDAVALEQAGAGMIVLEAMPALLAAEITAHFPFPPSASVRARRVPARCWCCTTCWISIRARRRAS